MIHIDELVEAIDQTVQSHYLGDGAWCRWLWQDAAGSRKLGINEYGCADAVNLLYTIGHFPKNEERVHCIQALQKLQDPETGLFTEATHHTIHTSAHCTAALELLDAKPLYPFKAFDRYKTKEGLVSLFESLDWVVYPWNQSHQGAGIFSALALAEEVSEEWKDFYFEWLANEADPVTGFWRKGCIFDEVNGKPVSLFFHLASSFHYLFNHEYAKRPLMYPDKMIDSCIKVYDEGIYENMTSEVGFATIDLVYCLNRASRQTAHRFNDCKNRLADLAGHYIAYLKSLNYVTHEGFNDLHMLFGAGCALAELQQALPGYIRTKKPLRLVLDRRPFI